MLYVRMAVRDPNRPESQHVDYEFPLDEWRELLDRALNVALGFQDRTFPGRSGLHRDELAYQRE